MRRIRKPRTSRRTKITKPFSGKIKTIEIEESLSRFFGIRTNIIVPNLAWG